MSEVQNEQQIDTNVVVAHRIRAIMKDQRWSARKAAERLGLQNTFISRRLSGETPLDPADLVMFASFLNVPVSRFFTEPDNSTARVTDIDVNKTPKDVSSLNHTELVERDVVHVDFATKRRA
jgi:transcriptional regulator with XRE-family HTH domain